jgi:O-antigen/teichoic acid export membrane protein
MRRTPYLRNVGWGIVDQTFSSATNFGLALLAGRLLGPGGLGVVLVGYAFYLLALGFQRALVSEPLVAVSAALPARERQARARHALSLSLATGALMAAVMATLGLVIPASPARGLVYAAPWLTAALVQDLCRTVLFRDGRARAATLNDAIWLGAMFSALPLTLANPGEWSIVGCWGVGAAIAALTGLLQLRIMPSRPGPAVSWWRTEASVLGRWLGMSSVVYSLGTHVSTFALAGLLGAQGLGGLRAASTAFGPLTLVIPALSLPGLPLVVKARERSRAEALRLTLWISATATLATAVYSAVFFARPSLLSMIFGSQFARFEHLILPIGLAQIVAATTVGFGLLLRADGRGRALFGSQVVNSAAALLLATTGAVVGGVTAVAWAAVAVAVIGSSTIVALTLWPFRAGAASSRPFPLHVRASLGDDVGEVEPASGVPTVRA